jgi:exodeoxyribonuclease V alpha subunit
VRDGDADAAVALLRDAGGAEAAGSLRFVATDDRCVQAERSSDRCSTTVRVAGCSPRCTLRRPVTAQVRSRAVRCPAAVRAPSWSARGSDVGGSSAAHLVAHVGRAGLPPGDVWLPGEPVMALANDERTGLVNGDTGVVVGRGGARRLVFERRDGTLLERPAEALPDVTSAYAVTVHKSQGSEYGTVVVVLPPPASPLATRELLYTAITRARRRVVIVGDEAAVRAAVDRPSVRMGGLADGLARSLPASSRSG